MSSEASGENPLDREIASALDGIDLQALGRTEAEDSPGARTGKRGGGDQLMPGTVAGISGDDVIVELGPRMQGVCALTDFENEPKIGESHRFMLRGREDDLWILSLRGAKELEDELHSLRVTLRTSHQLLMLYLAKVVVDCAASRAARRNSTEPSCSSTICSLTVSLHNLGEPCP